MYQRGFVLDEDAKAQVRSLAMEVGICDDCGQSGTLRAGFRAQIMGTVLALGLGDVPPLISVQNVQHVVFESLEAETDAAQATDAPAPAGGTAIQTGSVDCSTFVSTHVFDGLGLTMNYVVNVDEATGDGNFSAQVIYEGTVPPCTTYCLLPYRDRPFRGRFLSNSNESLFVLGQGWVGFAISEAGSVSHCSLSFSDRSGA